MCITDDNQEQEEGKSDRKEKEKREEWRERDWEKNVPLEK